MRCEQIKAVMLGHAVGDALGLPVQFRPRTWRDEDPVAEMRGFGAFNMPAGAWSDDTSMSLCMLESLSKGSYDAKDIMDAFARWYYEGDYTPTGRSFDLGGTCSSAIINYRMLYMSPTACGAYDERSNGNGSLMRIHPLTMYLAKSSLSTEERIELIHASSALTHAHECSKIGCGLYSFVLWELLKTPEKASVERGLRQGRDFYTARIGTTELCRYERLFSDISALPRSEIKSGGYVVSTLEAAIWCLLNTDSYKSCVLEAVNLGDDTDTTAAVAGGLAGALYGLDAIPQNWLDTLLRRKYIEGLCENFYNSLMS